MQLIQHFFKKIQQAIFPEKCISCKTLGNTICENCFLKIPCSQKKYKDILYFYNFRDVLVNKLLWQLKYYHVHDIGKKFGKSLAENFEREQNFPQDTTNILILPIPLNSHDVRMYNHAEIIANSFADHFSKTCEVLNNFFKKNAHAKQSHTNNKIERVENIKDAIKINSKYFDFDFSEFTKIIILDDVTTTGSTLDTAKNSLIEKFQEIENKIILLTVAH